MRMSNFWLCLYILETPSQKFLAYGYATQADGNSDGWRRSVVDKSNAPWWRLWRVTTYMNRVSLDAWARTLEEGPITLEIENHPVVIETWGLVHRPPVYAPDRSNLSLSSPQSLSDQLVTVEAYWQLRKSELLFHMFPSLETIQGRTTAQKVCQLLQNETGIRFVSEEIDRIGNFEIVSYLLGDYETPDGLHVDTVWAGSEGRYAQGVTVWLEPPLSTQGVLMVGCRLFNGDNARTIILDQIKAWPAHAHDVGMSFRGDEVISGYEVSVWRESNGVLVAHQRRTLLRSIQLNSQIAGGKRRILGPWVESFPDHLKDRASTVQSTSTTKTVVGDFKQDPWVSAAQEAAILRETFFPADDVGKFLENSSLSQVATFEFILERINRSGVTRVILADPYFGPSAIEPLLARIDTQGDVQVLTSCQSGIDPDVGTPHIDTDPGTDLHRACDNNAHLLPRHFELVSLENPGGDAQQFHDRYLMVQIGHQREVWALSNSLNSAARRFPLLIVRLPDALAQDVTDYLEAMYNGQIQGRSDLIRNVVWKSDDRKPKAGLPIPQVGPLGIPLFDGWDELLNLLVPDSDKSEEKIRIAVERNILVETNGTVTWTVPDGTIAVVTDRVIKALEKVAAQGGDIDKQLSALAQWAYHGGPDPFDYDLTNRIAAMVPGCLERSLKAETDESTQVTLEALSEPCGFLASLEPAMSLMKHPDPIVRAALGRPESTFFVELLWRHMPERLLEIIAATRNWITLSLLLEGILRGRPQKAGAFYASSLPLFQAIGVALVWISIQGKPHRLQVLHDQLDTVGAPISDIIRLTIYILVREIGNANWTDDDMADLESVWTVPVMGDQSLLDQVFARRTRLGAAVELDKLIMSCSLGADRDVIRQWMVEGVLQHLPLQAGSDRYQEGGQGVEFYPTQDSDCFDAFARAYWALYRDQTPTRFINVLNQVSFKGLRRPLLRSADYFRWRHLVDGALFSLRLAVAVVRASDGRSADVWGLKDRIVNLVFHSLGQEIWIYPDFSDLLENIVSHGAVLACDTREAPSAELVEFLGRPGVPVHWKVSVLLASPEVLSSLQDTMTSLMRDRNVRRALLHTDDRRLKGWLEHIRTYRGSFVRKVRGWLNTILRRQRLIIAPFSENSLGEGLNTMVNGLKLAATYGLSDIDLANALRVSIDRLRANPLHPDFQPFLQRLEELFRLLDELGISKSDISEWLRSENPAFHSAVPGSRPLTPWEATCNGRLDEVVRVVVTAREGIGV